MVNVGDDAGALAAAKEIERLQARIEDPYLQSAAHMAMSWTLPILDDFEGALSAASLSIQGFRAQDEPFMAAIVVFTLGMLEMAMGRYEDAHRHLSEVHATGGQDGDNWLTAVACVQLASLAVDAGRPDEARALLDESLHNSLGTERSTHLLTFCLVAYAKLAAARGEPRQAALALGAVEGLRARAGLRPWPLVRPGEAELLAGVKQAFPPDQFQDAFVTGSQLSRREAIDIVRGEASS
ncbi:MAG: tetratricopeptide repeat protein [Dehalococcoidia bacterium]|nr:tetratricopeptide repeat protein [Dehalococcoidia bacterium]